MTACEQNCSLRLFAARPPRPNQGKTGKIDAVCSSDGPWTYTSAAVLDYTEPMIYIPFYLYGRKGETRFKNMESANAPHVKFSAIDGDISLAMATDSFTSAVLQYNPPVPVPTRRSVS